MLMLLWVRFQLNSCLGIQSGVLTSYFNINCMKFLKPQSHKGEDIEMKQNEVYGVSMATQRAGQSQMPGNALMSRNVCYATTQHMEIVDNECYGCVPEK